MVSKENMTEHYPSRAETAKSKFRESLPASVLKHTHDMSYITLAQALTPRKDKNDEKFSASLLKNRNLLVPTRLALKRQRAAVRSPLLQYEPIRSETFQIELGNTNENSQVLPGDISLMYREKPSAIHSITGDFIDHYQERNGSPSPCSYVLPRKSCREKTAPAYSFGTRCFVEKNGGSRTAWEKQWFAHSNPFTTKVDFNRENSWPTPFHYPARPTIGFQSTKVTFPAWSIGTRFLSSPIFSPDNNPSPNTYNTTIAFRKSTEKSLPITIKSRIGGTKISLNQSKNFTPGPGAHDEKNFFVNKPSSPKHTFGKRIPASLSQDPYVNVLPMPPLSSSST